MELDLAGLVLPERVEIAETTDDGKSGQFVIEPLERGFGYTLGNSVRRALLSSLRGSAIWAFRIDGVVHEHQTIQGVVEDVHQVIQNLKSLVLCLDDDADEATLELQVKKAGEVTAGQINPSPVVEVLDPDHHLFTLEEAVQKTATMPARVHNLDGRGVLTEGGYADIVIMDLPNLKVVGSELEPRKYPKGIEYVFVNGVSVVEKGKHTGSKPGKVLKRTN